MTTAERRGPKGRGRITLTFDETGRPAVELTAFEVRMAYRTLYSSGRRSHRHVDESEIDRSMAQSGVP